MLGQGQKNHTEGKNHAKQAKESGSKKVGERGQRERRHSLGRVRKIGGLKATRKRKKAADQQTQKKTHEKRGGDDAEKARVGSQKRSTENRGG